MSYCRMSEESDVYVYPSIHGIKCCSCKLLPDWEDFNTLQAPNMLLHLLEHVRQGHKVPDHAFIRLMEEIGSG